MDLSYFVRRLKQS